LGCKFALFSADFLRLGILATGAASWSFPMRLLGKALTFDDVLLVPAFSQVLPRDTSLATRCRATSR
jgi:hypothetical protein